MNSEQFLSWLDRKSQLSLSSNPFEKPLIMGVLNVTPNSHYDGGKFLSLDRACEQAFSMIAHGANIIDIGGESTKPGVEEVPLDLELERVIPVIQHIRAVSDVCISIDTYKPEVMRAAVQAGASIINDICALQEANSLEVAAQLDVPVCLMHMQGKPQNMQQNPMYPSGVVEEISQFFSQRITACIDAGIGKEKIIIDPGFGFGKRVKDNLCLTKRLNEFKAFNAPLLLGVSRKSTIGAVLAKDAGDRLIGSIALTVYAALQGADIIRAHDVDETNQALTMIEALFSDSSVLN